MSCFACKPSAPVEVDSDKVILFFNSIQRTRKASGSVHVACVILQSIMHGRNGRVRSGRADGKIRIQSRFGKIWGRGINKARTEQKMFARHSSACHLRFALPVVDLPPPG